MNTRTTIATALALTCGSAFAQNTPGFNEKIPDEIMTPDKVETSIGTLNFADGIPDAEPRRSSTTTSTRSERSRPSSILFQLHPSKGFARVISRGAPPNATRCSFSRN